MVVGVTGSPSSEAALRRAVQDARSTGRVLVAVLAWEPPGGAAAYQMSREPRLEEMWERNARRRLSAAFDALFGGTPDDIPVQLAVVRGAAADVLSELADQPGDLLVLGAGPRRALGGALRGRVRRRAVAATSAPALLVAPPSVSRADRRRLRRLRPGDFGD